MIYDSKFHDKYGDKGLTLRKRKATKNGDSNIFKDSKRGNSSRSERHKVISKTSWVGIEQVLAKANDNIQKLHNKWETFKQNTQYQPTR